MATTGESEARGGVFLQRRFPFASDKHQRRGRALNLVRDRAGLKLGFSIRPRVDRGGPAVWACLRQRGSLGQGTLVAKTGQSHTNQGAQSLQAALPSLGSLPGSLHRLPSMAPGAPHPKRLSVEAPKNPAQPVSFSATAC